MGLVPRRRFTLNRSQSYGEDCMHLAGAAGLGSSFTHTSKSGGQPALLSFLCCWLRFMCCLWGCAVNQISNRSRLKYLSPPPPLPPPSSPLPTNPQPNSEEGHTKNELEGRDGPLMILKEMAFFRCHFLDWEWKKRNANL